jgi:hypothetical protein
MNNTESPSKLHYCSDACGFCRATARLAVIKARNAKFDAILDAEEDVRSTSVCILFTTAGVPDYVHARRHQSLKSAKKRLSDAIDSLTPQEMRMFGTYRAAQRGYSE